MNGRFFPNNWRPALDEIAFAAGTGFAAIQFPGKEEGLSASHLGAELGILSAALAQAGIAAVMEIMVQTSRQLSQFYGKKQGGTFQAHAKSGLTRGV